MFYYFGYGSNMNAHSLRAKGVEPLSAEPAVLKDWKLTFNIPDFFHIEGGTGNVVPDPGNEVHGMLYGCLDEASTLLDALEAVGVSYERSEVEVETYSGEMVKAHIYVGIEERLREGYQPSRRYLNILLHGAQLSKLKPSYLKKLGSQEVKSEPFFRPFNFPSSPDVYARDQLKPNQTAIAGAVFDMSQARPEHDYLRKFLSGKDMTLFFLRRMDSSTGEETWDEIQEDRLTPSQRRYLNNYLHEFDREYQLIGVTDYRLNLIQGRYPSSRLNSPHGKASAMQVLELAESTNKRLGHENLGFLSYSHGFLPSVPPRLSMPQTYKVWDDVVADLPRLYRTLELRKTIDHMPVLDASEEALGDSYLLRACAILAMLTHAYNYVEVSAPASIPDSLTIPWAEVRRRLGREQEVLSYIDLIVYNWRLIDGTGELGRCVENMDLLIPTVGNKEERFFYLTQTEILAQSSPIIGAIARSHEAIRNNDKAAVEQELHIILKCLETVVYHSLLKINPNDASHTFVDPVTWAKTVAPFAVPLKQGVQGPSGTSSPLFNLLDTFFGRVKHETFLGKEIKGLRSTYPHFWREFMAAVGTTSIAQYVQETNDPSLSAMFRETFNMYAGPNGFLGRHRTKVFGYLETAFKVGRAVTIGGFAGLFKERTWEQVDQELEYSRIERTEKFPTRCFHGRIKSVGQTHLSATESVKHVVLDIAGSGIFYRPGDRCGILPENSDHLIDQTLEQLEASGDEIIELTDEWLKAVQLRQGYETATKLPLRSFLRFAKLRPVVLRVAEALHAMTQNLFLQDAIKKQQTGQWQFSDLLMHLKEGGADAKVLWQSAYNEPYHIARILPPEQFRMYSISSGQDNEEIPSEIHLTVGRLRYSDDERNKDHFRERLGTASNFLVTGHGRDTPVSIIIDHPPRFSLPLDPKTPIVMIGGGTGFAPFRSFIANRLQEKDAGKSWLLLSLRDKDHFYYQDDLIPALANNTLELNVVFSQEDSRPKFRKTGQNFGKFEYVSQPRAHIQDLLEEGENAAKLWRLLQKKEDGGEEAYLYICGRTRFSKSIHDALKKTFAQFFEGSESEKETAAHRALAKIAAEGRFMQEIFTHARSWNTERKEIDVSEVVEHNSNEKGNWMIIDDVVYDLTDFMELHPGGRGILQHYCGLDATQGFSKVHMGHSEIEAMRDMYEIGVVRHPDFKGASRVVQLPGALSSVVAVSALYRKWVGVLYVVVEMENALRMDQGLQKSVTTRGEVASERTNYKLQRSIETHQRFITSYANELSGRPLIELWDLTRGMSDGKSAWMQDVMAAIHESPNAKFPLALGIKMNLLLDDIVKSKANAHNRDVFIHACELIENCDMQLLLRIKECIRSGLKIFEELEHRTLEEGAWKLVAQLQEVPVAFENYYRETEQVFKMMGGSLDETPCSVAPLYQEVVHFIYADKFWCFEEHEAFCNLRRTPIPIDSMDEMIASNERLIALFEERYENYGIVVDMREPPKRNDQEFENAMHHLRMALAQNFARLAVLLETPTGLLQVDRIRRNDGIGSEVFATMNDYAALKFASTKVEAPTVPHVGPN